MVRALRFLLVHPELRGPFNVVGPETLDNAGFTRTLGAYLRRPTILPLPGFMARAGLGDAGVERQPEQGDAPALLRRAAGRGRSGETPADLDRAWLAAWPQPGAATFVPLCSQLLGICDWRARKIRRDQGWLAGSEAANALPPLGRQRLRPGTTRT